ITSFDHGGTNRIASPEAHGLVQVHRSFPLRKSRARTTLESADRRSDEAAPRVDHHQSIDPSVPHGSDQQTVDGEGELTRDSVGPRLEREAEDEVAHPRSAFRPT